MVAMASLRAHDDQAGVDQFRPVPACRLRRHAGGGRELSCRQRPAIHERVEHVGPAGIADQRADLREPALLKRCLPLRLRTRSYRTGCSDTTPPAVASSVQLS